MGAANSMPLTSKSSKLKNPRAGAPGAKSSMVWVTLVTSSRVIILWDDYSGAIFTKDDVAIHPCL